MYMLYVILSYAFVAYSYLIIASVLMSWIPPLQESAFGRFIRALTDPYLSLFQRIIPPLGMIDISPIVALIVLNLASRGLQTLFFNFLLQ